MTEEKIQVSKIEAARRQLDCAIELWFLEKDEVSIHTLAGAAYQIIHDLNQHRGNRRDLLYDSFIVRDEYRKTWVRIIKKAVNFFKHADNDPEGVVEFSPFQNLMFIMFSMVGLNLLGQRSNDYDNAVSLWLTVNQPELIVEKHRVNFGERVTAADVETVKRIKKVDFLGQYLQAQARNRRLGTAL